MNGPGKRRQGTSEIGPILGGRDKLSRADGPSPRVGFPRVSLSFSLFVGKSEADGTFSAALSNAGRWSTLTAVNIQQIETRRGNARQSLALP
jgi:hypothetical protein